MEDIRFINNHHLVYMGDTLPKNLQYATYRNKDRDAIICALFLKYCEEHKDENGFCDAILVFSDNVQRRNEHSQYVPVSNRLKKVFWENCGEDDTGDLCKRNNKKERVDPVLKLHRDSRVMLTENLCVANGLANGT